MEDAHTTILDLDEDGSSDKTAFFAVYDGHGGVYHLHILSYNKATILYAGAAVARFAGRNVHKRLTAEDAYHEKQYNAALKKAFLGTDEDIRAGSSSLSTLRLTQFELRRVDPSFFHDPSGCTAVAALLTSDRKLYVVRASNMYRP